jgi:hypothetical protein
MNDSSLADWYSNISQWVGKWRNGVLRLGFLLFALVLVAPVYDTTLTLKADEAAVIVDSWTGKASTIIGPNTYTVGLFQTATVYSLAPQMYIMSGVAQYGMSTDAVTARTHEGQEVAIDLSLVYRINPDQLISIHQRWQQTYAEDFIRPTLRYFVRDGVAESDAPSLYYPGRRAPVLQQIQEKLQSRLYDEGFVFMELVIDHIQFSDQFREYQNKIATPAPDNFSTPSPLILTLQSQAIATQAVIGATRQAEYNQRATDMIQNATSAYITATAAAERRDSLLKAGILVIQPDEVVVIVQSETGTLLRVGQPGTELYNPSLRN